MSIAGSSKGNKGNSVATLASQLEASVRKAAEEGQSLRQVERDILRQVLGIGKACVDELIALQGDGNMGKTIVTEEGQELHRSEQPVERPLRTVFGEHVVHAYVYAPGSHQAIALRPVDARLGLPQGRYSYLFEEFSQYFCVEDAFAQAAFGLETVLGQKVPVDTLERLNRRVGEQAAPFLDELPTPPVKEEGELLVFSGDCKGVPLVRDDRQKVPAFEKTERPGNRRMATLATVYSVDSYVRTPEQIVAALFRDEAPRRRRPRPEIRFKHVVARFGRTYEDGVDTLETTGPVEAFSWAAEQLATRRRPDQRVVRLLDGQVSLWKAADDCLGLSADQTVDILDILHVSSYVWRAAKVFHSEREQQEAFARDRLLRILRGEVRKVVSGMRQSGSKRCLSGSAAEELRTVCGYLAGNADRMRYDEYLRRGYPIATGVIEGACRHLVKDRLERSGMRWRLRGAQAMLDLRAVYQSSYWEQFHVHRVEEEQQQLHPHRELLSEYTPKPLAA
jgi:hypothetical protein